MQSLETYYEEKCWFIRNKKMAQDSSRRIQNERENRLNRAIENHETYYISKELENVSTYELIKMILNKLWFKLKESKDYHPPYSLFYAIHTFINH